MELKRYQRILLSLISGVLISLPWLHVGMGYFLLFAFVPLLFVEDYIYENRKKYSSLKLFNLSYLGIFTWNVLAQWWISYATLFGAIAAMFINAFFVTIVFWIFHLIRRSSGTRIGYLSFVVLWLAFEYVHLNWELSWPWIMLGHGLSGNIHLVQWYEYTGSQGGTLWILVSNLLIFISIKSFITNKKYKIQLSQSLAFIIIPIVISLSIFYSYVEKENPRNIVVVQPNIDPYNDKFGGISPAAQLKMLLELAKTKTNSKTDFIVGPETALVRNLWEEKLHETPEYYDLKKFLQSYPKAKFVIGLSSLREYRNGEEISATARKFYDADKYYDSYNTAMLVDTTLNIQLYHKSQLVIGVEKIPFPSVLGSLALDLGGTVGSLGTQKERTVFKSLDDTVGVAPVICYESVYGEFVSDYVKNGADLIFIITNDGWWEDTPGYKHHLSYASLRAIETRRSIARSANTGIS
ncbi:MAG: apolipoprotein N-acyltransferase, partial [Bacteroidetes bacterium RIFOXYA12_FULL_33_9]